MTRRRAMTFDDRYWSKVAKAEGCWEWTGSRRADGYGQISYTDLESGKSTNLSAHRLGYEKSRGPIPAGLVIDHICRNRACVNPDHLRAVTQKQNSEHVIGAKRNSKTGVLGVSWHKGAGKFQAQVSNNGKDHHVGLFDTIPEAEAAVIAKRLELHTHNDADRAA